MSQEIAQFPDEAPTIPMIHLPTRELTLRARVVRLAELAIERLETDPDSDAIVEAIGDLARIRDICAEAGR